MEGTLYEVINMSDNVGLWAPDDTTAAVAGLILGEGHYAVKTTDGERREVLPILMFGGAEEWIAEHLDPPDLGSYLTAHASELAQALETCVVDPKDFVLLLSAAPEGADIAALKARWQDAHRTSLNDIVARAERYACRLRVVAQEGTPGAATTSEGSC